MKYILLFFLLIGAHSASEAQTKNTDAEVPQKFFELAVAPPEDKARNLEYIKNNWDDSFIPMVIEVLYLSGDSRINAELIALLESKTGKDFGFEINKWYEWIWNKDEAKHPEYAKFKSLVYALIDPRFAGYFDNEFKTTIRLDEVRWGGVRQDGIPPLRHPEMIKASQAKYLDDSNIVFGIQVNGDTRAYPKRIMAWHEMFVDKVGGKNVAGVYCTLCGSMILYNTEVGGTNYKVGTSGFLYRSNKLMYDQATQSLWNTLWGKPVIGKLVGKGVELERMSIVTTTWGEWKNRHPETKVLSLNTGYSRDYGEGVAYNEYFATDDLMFTVPKVDKRLKNKDEVLGLVFAEHPDKPLAISAKFLSKNPIYKNSVGKKDFIVFTDKSGASRVYENKGVEFNSWDQNTTAKDTSGTKWALTESKLVSESGKELYRLPSHKAFWFGWYSAYTNTKLIL